MAESKTLRLNKVLRELNISLDRAVEHLADKGFQIEARPTTKISNKEYEVLLDGFQTDRTKKAASEEVSEEKRKEKEAIRIANEEKMRLEEEAKKVILAKAEKLEIKTVGKIEISPKKEKVTKPIVKEETPKEQKQPKKTEPIKLKKEVAKISEKQPKPVVKEEVTKKEIKKDKIKEIEQPKTEEETVSLKKRKTEYKKLDGPKIIGEKIDLDQFKKTPKKKKITTTPKKSTTTPKKTETSNKKEEAEANKKKRRRIVKKARIPNANKKGGSWQNRGGQRGRKQIIKEEPSEAEVQKQVRETLEKLQGKSKKGKGAKYRKDKRDHHRQQSDIDLELQAAESKVLKVTEFVTVSEIATMMDIPVTNIISTCMSLGMMVTMNQRLDAETITIVAEEFDHTVNFVGAEVEEAIEEHTDTNEELETRAPIITVMGHVNHGKTSILDVIKKTDMVNREAGGITQQKWHF